jgi:hypothetical protein
VPAKPDLLYEDGSAWVLRESKTKGRTQVRDTDVPSQSGGRCW